MPVSSRWLTVTVVVGLVVTGNSDSQRCDNGKLSLEMDLSSDAAQWDCSAGFPLPASTLRRPLVDGLRDPEPAAHVCMDQPISYNRSIPNSGDYRPVRAESGEYLYCPPQRWLNNLHHGAAVLLYHPCAAPRQRHLLSELARSCLTDWILSPHPQLSRLRPMALLSWGLTVELPSVVSPQTCRWLERLQSNADRPAAPPAPKYNFLLSWSAEPPTDTEESVRRCCERTITSALSQTGKEKDVRERRPTSAPRIKRHNVERRRSATASKITSIRGRTEERLTEAPPFTDSGRRSANLKDANLKDANLKDANEKSLVSTNTKMKENQVTQRHVKHELHGGAARLASQPVSKAAAVLLNVLPETPRSDEAVWAACALGFLLVLLTLSVLHSRLLRYWRSSPSLYWYDPRHDYDRVADVIRRRLRMTKRRRRSRTMESVLIPSSSSSDEPS